MLQRERAGAGDEAQDDPASWRGTTRLLDLGDPKLRLKARSLTQLCKNEREKALAVYGFVKRLPFGKPMKLRYRTAREVLDAGSGDGDDKGTLLVALLRAAGIPARLRYVELSGEMLRGLIPNMARAARPLAEIWLGGRWVRTDTYIFDAAYLAAARQRVKDEGWECGYGLHVAAHSLWNGTDDAYLGGIPTAEDPRVLRELAVVSDPQELGRTPAARFARALHWNAVAPGMEKVIRQLREEALGAAPVPQRP